MLESHKPGHLVLAGCGHSHALVLLRWIMFPDSRPQGLITLINRQGYNHYSSMIPGLISGIYKSSETLIDLNFLAFKAGVSMIKEEINSIDPYCNCIYIKNRPPIYFDWLSINMGTETLQQNRYLQSIQSKKIIPIKPFEGALDMIESQDRFNVNDKNNPFTIIGSGLAAIEIAFALRNRWNERHIQIQLDANKLSKKVLKLLVRSRIKLLSKDFSSFGSALLCTGNQASKCILESSLDLDSSGRLLTRNTFQLINHQNIFAAGDCAVIDNAFRPASGVWAVRAAKPLAINLERVSKQLALKEWRPQKNALQLIGSGKSKHRKPNAIMIFNKLELGPRVFLWRLKESIDRSFVDQFKLLKNMNRSKSSNLYSMDCRGCGAKISSESLKLALDKAGFLEFSKYPEDSALIAASSNGQKIYQSVDGFPALISDPWLNARLVALHACSDIWASGASVISAQAIITIPNQPEKIKQELLAQCISGINSVLLEQGASLIGGHSLESRSEPPDPSTLGIQISMAVNGLLKDGISPWLKSGLQKGDYLLLSRSIGTGVLFSSAMKGKALAKYIDLVLSEITVSQYKDFDSLMEVNAKSNLKDKIHASTDITGFGLLGHLVEMLTASNSAHSKQGLPPLKINLFADLIPYFHGVMELFSLGFSSTLAPSNRMALKCIDPIKSNNQLPQIDLILGDIIKGSQEHKSILELIIDPQTCGPLLISCSHTMAKHLEEIGPWTIIGNVVNAD